MKILHVNSVLLRHLIFEVEALPDDQARIKNESWNLFSDLVYWFYMIHRTKSDCFPKQYHTIESWNRDAICFLRGSSLLRYHGQQKEYSMHFAPAAVFMPSADTDIDVNILLA